MSTTHLTFENKIGSYAVVSHNNIKDFDSTLKSFSLLVLNNDNKFQRSLIFDNFAKLGFKEIISIENSNPNYDLESLVNKHVNLKFIVIKDENMTVGEKINIGFQESKSNFIFVTNSNLEISSFSSKMIEKIEQSDVMCIVPVISNGMDTLPSAISPIENSGNISITNSIPNSDGQNTLYPYEFIGIYNRDKFIQMEGFDKNIKSEFYQKMDFGFRAFMWGENIQFNLFFKVNLLNSNISIEDMSQDESYNIFCLKNLLIKYDGERGFIPLLSFFSYFKQKFHKNLLSSFKEFLVARRVVENFSYRYKCGSKSVLDKWNNLSK